MPVRERTQVRMTLTNKQTSVLQNTVKDLEEAFAGPWLDIWQTWGRMSESDRQRVREASPTFDCFMKIAGHF